MSDIPHSEEMIKRARKLMPPGLTEGDDADGDNVSPQQQQMLAMQQQMQQFEMRLKEAETKETEAKADKAEAEAKKANAEAENEAIDTMLKKVEFAEKSGQLPPGAAQIVRLLMENPEALAGENQAQQPAPMPEQGINPLATAQL